jgi:hypothetical protein
VVYFLFVQERQGLNKIQAPHPLPFFSCGGLLKLSKQDHPLDANCFGLICTRRFPLRRTDCSIGIFVAVGLNIDSVEIAQRLWRDPVMRTALVQDAQAYLEKHKHETPKQRIDAAGKELDIRKVQTALGMAASQVTGILDRQTRGDSGPSKRGWLSADG